MDLHFLAAVARLFSRSNKPKTGGFVMTAGVDVQADAAAVAAGNFPGMDSKSLRDSLMTDTTKPGACPVDAQVAQECSDYATSLRSEYYVAKLQGREPQSFMRAAALFEKAACALRTRAKPPSQDNQDDQHSPTPTLESKAIIVDGCLTILIPVDTLVFAAQNSDYFFDAAENGEGLAVTNQSDFAKSVAHALNAEAEDGSTPVTRMLDKAFIWVVEQGEEGVDAARADTGDKT